MSFASGMVWMVLALARDGDGGREAGFGSKRVKDLETWRGRGLGACVGEDELDMLMICRVGGTCRIPASSGKSRQTSERGRSCLVEVE
jgi:hypothetical protein